MKTSMCSWTVDKSQGNGGNLHGTKCDSHECGKKMSINVLSIRRGESNDKNKKLHLAQ